MTFGATVAGIVLVALPAAGRSLRTFRREDPNDYLDPYRQHSAHQPSPYHRDGDPHR